MRSYNTARRIFSVLEFFGNLLLLGGIGLAIIVPAMVDEFTRNPSAPLIFGSAIPGVLIAIMGLRYIASVQDSRTAVDSAEYSQQSLKVARDALELSRKAFAYQQSLAATPTQSPLAQELGALRFDTDTSAGPTETTSSHPLAEGNSGQSVGAARAEPALPQQKAGPNSLLEKLEAAPLVHMAPLDPTRFDHSSDRELVEAHSYFGNTIEEWTDGYRVDGKLYSSKKAAEASIDARQTLRIRNV